MESENEISKSESSVTSRCDTDTHRVVIVGLFRVQSRGLTRAFAKMSPPGRNERNRIEENYIKRKKKLPYRDKKRKVTKKIKSRWKTSSKNQVSLN